MNKKKSVVKKTVKYEYDFFPWVLAVGISLCVVIIFIPWFAVELFSESPDIEFLRQVFSLVSFMIGLAWFGCSIHIWLSREAYVECDE